MAGAKGQIEQAEASLHYAEYLVTQGKTTGKAVDVAKDGVVDALQVKKNRPGNTLSQREMKELERLTWGQ